jgi:hypothetical protein
LAEELWSGLEEDGPAGNEVGRGRVFRTMKVDEVLDGVGYVPALRSRAPKGRLNLKYSRRQAGGFDAYFLFNPNEEAASFDCDVADEAGRRPEIWNPADGSEMSLPVFRQEQGRTVFSVRIPGRNSVFVVLRTAARPEWVSVESQAPVLFRQDSGGRWTMLSETAGPITLVSASGKTSVVTAAAPRTLSVPEAWTLRFGEKPAISLTALKSWVDFDEEDVKNFSGLGIYETKVEVPESFLQGAGRVALDLGEVSRACRVQINGRDAGTLWRSPWSLPVEGFLRTGANTIRIEVVNSWYNRMMADQLQPEAGRQTWTTWPRMKEWVAEQSGPEPGGLLGPVSLIAYPTVPLSPE